MPAGRPRKGALLQVPSAEVGDWPHKYKRAAVRPPPTAGMPTNTQGLRGQRPRRPWQGQCQSWHSQLTAHRGHCRDSGMGVCPEKGDGTNPCPQQRPKLERVCLQWTQIPNGSVDPREPANPFVCQQRRVTENDGNSHYSRQPLVKPTPFCIPKIHHIVSPGKIITPAHQLQLPFIPLILQIKDIGYQKGDNGTKAGLKTYQPRIQSILRFPAVLKTK